MQWTWKNALNINKIVTFNINNIVNALELILLGIIEISNILFSIQLLDNLKI